MQSGFPLLPFRYFILKEIDSIFFFFFFLDHTSNFPLPFSILLLVWVGLGLIFAIIFVPMAVSVKKRARQTTAHVSLKIIETNCLTTIKVVFVPIQLQLLVFPFSNVTNRSPDSFGVFLISSKVKVWLQKELWNSNSAARLSMETLPG